MQTQLRRGVQGHTPLSAPTFLIAIAARDPRCFEDFWRGREVVKELNLQHRLGYAYTLAYTLLPEQLLWLLVLGRPWEIHEVVHRFKQRVARRLDRRVWRPGHRNAMLEAGQDRRQLAGRLIETPVRRGLVDSVADYPLWDHAWVAPAERGVAEPPG